MSSLKSKYKQCSSSSNANKFGLCDAPSPNNQPAYIDEQNGENWIAIIDNEPKFEVIFTAIDNCIDFKTADNKPSKRCDGVLSFNETIIFVELKDRSAKNNEWVKDGEKQLRTSIVNFEKSDSLDLFKIKKAYIANNQHPKFKSSQINRMQKFADETGFILRIENRIIL